MFMAVYGMGCDAILQCFILDELMNKGSEPKHCPGTLKEFFNEHKDNWYFSIHIYIQLGIYYHLFWFWFVYNMSSNYMKSVSITDSN